MVILLGLAAAASADGPGSRLRAGPPAPQPVGAAPKDQDLQRCEAMRAEPKARCLKDLRAAAAADGKARGPEATGAGSGAGAPR